MSLVTLIPAKPFDVAKTRLSPVLSTPQRKALAEALFRRTLTMATGFPATAQVRVVTRSPEIAEIAHGAGATALPETEAPGDGLSIALTEAAAQAFRDGASSILYLPADLPRLAKPDLEALIEAGKTRNVIAPDRERDGTNALLWHGPETPRFQFGTDSFQKHLAMLGETERGVEIVARPGLGLDLDTPEDLETWCASRDGSDLPLDLALAKPAAAAS
ncbi:2-phospho-L-lactate guanylyltransferase [Methyloligella sp. 2.7D]|uniref:2-phospho-L-lactate guanylyltransferase n=1 Tax=unclassified Methyloligella TaxID=2625955 RepID=UPI00157C9E9B|nr:2-phospho-L-lactate guanylyltransferase [Methyloligella sp. GL2]QKP76949.1 2-phospho-L-lactate guanylyltransferase [Methyloligella sp. GL2]